MKRFLLILSLTASFLSLYAGTCPLAGDATDDRRKATNIKKNREAAPGAADFDSMVSMSKMLNSQDLATAFDENKAGTITGYLFSAKAEGPESCNCHATDAADHDIHIYIAPSKTTSSISECVVVEITPWVKKVHPEWTLAYLLSLKGHRVTIGGWLLYDWEHLGQSTAGHPDADHNVRGTVWEVHPITNIEDLDEDEDAPASARMMTAADETMQTSAIPGSPAVAAGGSGENQDANNRSPLNTLAMLILGAFLGVIGQGFRVIVGLKKLNDASADKEAFKNAFDGKKLLLSLLYSLAIGAISGVILVVNSTGNWHLDSKSLIAIIGAGYAGTDLIEGFVNKNLK